MGSILSDEKLNCEYLEQLEDFEEFKKTIYSDLIAAHSEKLIKERFRGGGFEMKLNRIKMNHWRKEK